MEVERQGSCIPDAPNSMYKGLRCEKPSTGNRGSVRGIGIDFLPGNGRDTTRNVGTVGTVDVLGMVRLMEFTGRKWSHCSALSLNQTIE